MTFTIEMEQEEDRRWIAEVIDLPGVLPYGESPEEARAKVQAVFQTDLKAARPRSHYRGTQIAKQRLSHIQHGRRLVVRRGSWLELDRDR